MCLRAMPLAVLLTFASGMAACGNDNAGGMQSGKVTYADDVLPILQKHCVECHAAGKEGAKATGLLVDTYASLMKGSDYGPVIEPGAARTSSLYILITGKENLTVNMPHGRAPLSDAEIGTIKAWIDSGAPEH